MRKLVIICTSLLLPVFIGNAQTRSSMYYNKIYDSKDGKPQSVIPSWIEYTFSEGGLSTVSDDVFNVKVKSGSSFGYFMPGVQCPDINSMSAVEVGVSASKLNSGMDIDLRTKDGDRVSIAVQNNYLINRVNKDTIHRDLDQSTFAAYRIQLDDNKNTKLYKNGELLSSFVRSSGDEIPNSGFEDNADKNYLNVWGFNGWTNMQIKSSDAHSGNNCLFWDNGWTGSMWADIPVQPNSKYKLSFWAKSVKVNAPQNGMNCYLKFQDGKLIKSSSIVPGNYQQFTAEFITSNYDEKVSLLLHNGWEAAGLFHVYIDDVELVRQEGEPYIQFGKISTTGEGDFSLKYVSMTSEKIQEPILFDNFKSLINRAQELKDNAVLGNNIGEYPQYAIERIEQGLHNATLITEEDNYLIMDEAYAKLKRETDRFENCRINNLELEITDLNVTPDLTKLKTGDIVHINLNGVTNDGKQIDPEVLFVKLSSENNLFTINDKNILTVEGIGTDKLIIEAQYINAIKTFEYPVVIDEYKLINIEASTYDNNKPIRLGDAIGINVSPIMTNDTPGSLDEIELSYESLNTDIALVNEYGTIIGVSPGLATIKITGKFLDKEISTNLDVEIITINHLELIASTKINKGDIIDYEVLCSYSDGTIADISKEDFIIYSEDRHVANVSDKGKIIAYNEGNTKIVVKVRQSTNSVSMTLPIIIESDNIENKTEEKFANDFSITQESDKLHIKCRDVIKNGLVSIISLNGEILKSSKITDTERITLPVSDIGFGIYTIVISDKQNQFTKKLIIR